MKGTAASHWMKVIALIYVAFLIYGTLSPWTGWSIPSSISQRFIEGSHRLYTFDLIQNALLYMPFGCLLRLGWSTSLIRCLLACIILSGSLEFIQAFNPARTPSLSDFLLNSAGGLFSAALTRKAQQTFHQSTVFTHNSNILSVCILGLLGYIVTQWWPFDPSLTAVHLKQQLTLFKSMDPFKFSINYYLLPLLLDCIAMVLIVSLFRKSKAIALGLFFVGIWAGKFINQAAVLRPELALVTLSVFLLACWQLMVLWLIQKHKMD